MRVKDQRGSSADRRARRSWLVSTFGDGKKCKCVHCGKTVFPEREPKVEADRIVPGSKGGTYARPNLQPSCRRCNAQRKDNEQWVGPRPQTVRA